MAIAYVEMFERSVADYNMIKVKHKYANKCSFILERSWYAETRYSVQLPNVCKMRITSEPLNRVCSKGMAVRKLPVFV